MPEPVVSILMPVFNGAATVEESVRSLTEQTFGDFEIVAVDDGSSDGSGALLDGLALRDSRIRVIHLPHAGLIPALNSGLAECRGDFIARMDADDICHLDRLRLQVDLMRERPDVSVCGSLVKSFPPEEVKGGFLKYEAWLNSLVTHEEIARDIFVESPLAHPSVMMRAADLWAVGGYREMGWPEDYDLWLRFHAAGKRFAKAPAVLLYWREHRTRLTFTDSRYSLENFMRVKAHFLAAVVAEKGWPLIVWGAGMTGRRLTKHLVREGAAPVAVVDIDPKKIGGTLRGIPVIAPEDLCGYADAFVVTAVGSQSAREIVRGRLLDMGRRETADFLCAS